MLCENSIRMLSGMEDFNVANISALQNCLGRELSEAVLRKIHEFAEEHIDDKKRKYGKTAQLMGALGYYHPSLILEPMTTNVRRGRIFSKRPTAYVFIYDFDALGAVIRITNIESGCITNILRQGMFDVCVTVCCQSQDVESVLVLQKDELDRPVKWVRFYYHNNMKVVEHVNAEMYQYMPSGNICTIVDGVVTREGRFCGLADMKYLFSFDDKGKVTGLTRLDNPHAIIPRRSLD